MLGRLLHTPPSRRAWLLLLPLLTLLGGCQAVLLSPSGEIALQQRNLMYATTVLMLLIVIPVMVLIVLVAWHYRDTNRTATYTPEWNHSLALEVAIWTVPLLIIIAIGALTWLGTHLLDPYRPLKQADAARPGVAQVEPLQVEVVALDWKWLFFYPQLGIASLNEMAAPVDRPISFKLTSTSVMNSFYVPALAGQIYTMPGMETKLHAVINAPGVYKGFSANFSGSGFSQMYFNFLGMSPSDFDNWAAKVKAQGAPLDRAAYIAVEKPSVADPVRYFSSVEDGLYSAILNLCTKPGQMCMSEMMHIDATGGGGKESLQNWQKLRYDGDRAGIMVGHGHGPGHAPEPSGPSADQPQPSGANSPAEPHH